MKIQNLKYKLISCGAIIALMAVMYILELPCPFNALVHMDCPGCGITRAYISLLHLDFKAAFSFHPMFWAVPLCLVLYLFDGKLFRKKWLNTVLITSLCLGFMGIWLIRVFS